VSSDEMRLHGEDPLRDFWIFFAAGFIVGVTVSCELRIPVLSEEV
jgi:hypothetical protein